MMNQDMWDIYGGLPSYALVLVQLQGLIFLAWEVAKSRTCVWSRVAVPNLFGMRDQFRGRPYFHELGAGGWFQDGSSALHLPCTLLLLLLQSSPPQISRHYNPEAGAPCSGAECS